MLTDVRIVAPVTNHFHTDNKMQLLIIFLSRHLQLLIRSHTSYPSSKPSKCLISHAAPYQSFTNLRDKRFILRLIIP